MYRGAKKLGTVIFYHKHTGENGPKPWNVIFVFAYHGRYA